MHTCIQVRRNEREGLMIDQLRTVTPGETERDRIFRMDDRSLTHHSENGELHSLERECTFLLQCRDV